MLVISQSVLSLLSPIIHYSKEFRKAERTRLEKEKAMNTQKTEVTLSTSVSLIIAVR